LNKSKYITEPEDQLLILNKKLNPNHTPNKMNQSYFPYIYNSQQVHSFISTYNNYPSTFSKGSFISTNNSSNNKYRKNEDHCSSEVEEEIRLNNYNFNNINNDEIKNSNSSYNHGNKFGPHLHNYCQLSNNNISNINGNISISILVYYYLILILNISSKIIYLYSFKMVDHKMGIGDWAQSPIPNPLIILNLMIIL